MSEFGGLGPSPQRGSGSRRRHYGAGSEGHGGGHDSSGAMRWLLTYADLITLLLAFFVVMYAMSEVNAAKYQALAASLRSAFTGAGASLIGTEGGMPAPPRAGAEGEAWLALVHRINSALREAGLGGRAAAELTDRGIAITFQELIFFDLGRDELRPEGQQVLRQLAPILAEVSGTILVEGHTDDLPIASARFPSNWELSTARATKVVRFLAEVAGIDPHRLVAAGYGEWRPRYANTSDANRARNRRVEIVLLRPGLDATAHYHVQQ